MKILLLVFLTIFSVSFFHLNSRVALAEHCGDVGGIEREACEATHSDGTGCDVNKSILGVPTWYKYLDTETDSTGRCSPVLTDTRSALPIGVAILEIGLRLAGLVATVMVVVGSFKFILARGNGDQVKEARNTVINALVGVIIVIISTGIVNYIGNRIG